MNRDCKPFDNNSFIYPVSSGIYSAREYKYIYADNTGLATSIYYKNGNEGIMTVSNNVNLLSSANGYAFSPVSVFNGSDIFTFWSDYNGKWHIKSTHEHEIPELDGNLFVYSACTDKYGSIHLACELMHSYMKSDIIVISNKGKAWEVSKKLNSENVFCKRPQIRAGNDGLYVVWDGYNGKGYDIYLNSYINDSWSGEIIVSDMNNWNLKPSISIDISGKICIAWLKNTDVVRDGVISKRNHVHMAVYDGEKITPVPGDGKVTPVPGDEVVRLDMGLLPVKRYFGYHGLRRNPQVACCENGDIALFWEMQRGEDEIWENVENGYFLCMFYNGKSWSKTFLIQDGGNCFTIDSTEMIGDTIHYAYRGIRGTGVDIKFGSINVIDLMDFKLPHYDEWDSWKPLMEKEYEKRAGMYWGDLHCHSIYSPDAEGYPDELFFYARDRCGLDFCAITDNDIYGENVLTKSALRYIQSICECLSKDGVFQAYCGFEWTYHRPGLEEPENFNHRTVIFMDNQVKIASRAEASGENESAFSATLAGTDTMWHAHHGIWRILDPTHDANAEIVSSWANNIEEFETVHQQLDEGQVFGFMGASDNHRFIPGNGGALTGVFSQELSKGALKKAFKNRKNYATCGTRPYVYFSINNSSMGDVIYKSEINEYKLYLHVESKEIIDYMEIIHNGEVFDSIKVDEKEFVYESKVRIPADNSYFYAKIKIKGGEKHFPHNIAQAEGKYIYSSPIWIV